MPVVPKRIGKLSPITPEDVKSQSGYTIFSYNKPRRQKPVSLKKEEQETSVPKTNKEEIKGDNMLDHHIKAWEAHKLKLKAQPKPETKKERR